MDSPKRTPYRPLGVSLRDFARQRIRSYVPSGDLVSRSSLPPSWAGTVSEPLEWQAATSAVAPTAPEPAVSEGTDVDTVVRRAEAPAPPAEPVNDGFSGMEAQLKAIVAAHERKRAAEMAVASSAAAPSPEAVGSESSSPASDTYAPASVQRAPDASPAMPAIPRRRRGSVIDVTPPQPTGIFDEREWEKLPAQATESEPTSASPESEPSGEASSPAVNSESRVVARAEAPVLQRSPDVSTSSPAAEAARPSVAPPVTPAPTAPAASEGIAPASSSRPEPPAPSWEATTSAPTPARVQRVTLDESTPTATAPASVPPSSSMQEAAPAETGSPKVTPAAEAALQRAEAPAAPAAASVPGVHRAEAAPTPEAGLASPPAQPVSPASAAPSTASSAATASAPSQAATVPTAQRAASPAPVAPSQAATAPTAQRAASPAPTAPSQAATPPAGSTAVVPPALVQRAEAAPAPRPAAPAKGAGGPNLAPSMSAAKETIPSAPLTVAVEPATDAPDMPAETAIRQAEAPAELQRAPERPRVTTSTGPSPESSSAATQPIRPATARDETSAPAPTGVASRTTASAEPEAIIQRSAAPAPVSSTPTPPPATEEGQPSPFRADSTVAGPEALTQALQRVEETTAPPLQRDSATAPGPASAAAPPDNAPSSSRKANAPALGPTPAASPADSSVPVSPPSTAAAQPAPLSASAYAPEVASGQAEPAAPIQRLPAEESPLAAEDANERGPLAEALRAAEQPSPSAPSVTASSVASPVLQRASAEPTAPKAVPPPVQASRPVTPPPTSALPDAPTVLEAPQPGISDAIQRAIAAAESPTPPAGQPGRTERPARGVEAPTFQRAADNEDAPTLETPARRPAPIVLDSRLEPSPWTSFMQKPEAPATAPPAAPSPGVVSGSRAQRAITPPPRIPESAGPPAVPAQGEVLQRALAEAEAPAEQEVDLYTALVSEGMVPPLPASERPQVTSSGRAPTPSSVKSPSPGQPSSPASAPGVQRKAAAQSVVELSPDQLPPASNVPEPGSVEAAMLDLLNLPPNTSVYGLKQPASHQGPSAPAGPVLQRKPLDQALSEPVKPVSEPHVQRAIEIGELTASVGGGETGGGAEGGEPDIDDLARKVYRILKDRLRIERERSAR